MATKSDNWTESRIADMLTKRFPAPAFAFLRQLRNGTGFQRKTVRTADAFAVSCYPSRGLYFVGIEIKVRLNDWRKELAIPLKAESIQRFCKYWYVAAPKGLIPVGEVPETWGLLECDERNTHEKKQAPMLNAQPPDMLFICSIVRNVTESYIPYSSISNRIRQAEKQATEAAKSDRSYELQRLTSKIETFEKASGVLLGDCWEYGDIGRAVKFVRECGADEAIASAMRIADEHEHAAKHIRKALAALKQEAARRQDT